MVVSPAGQPSVAARLRSAGCVFADEEADLLVGAAGGPDELDAMVRRRVAGEPLEHVLGWSRFCGLRIAVEPGVFVPRCRTEFLVHRAAALATGAEPAGPGPALVVVDLCCGSGAVGAALAANLGPLELHAVDLDPVAVRCARRNVAAAGGRVYNGDLYGPLPPALRGRVGILVANAPYVPTGAVGLLPREARVHEPRHALDGGADGLDVLRRVLAGAATWLAQGGHLVVESNPAQAPVLVELADGYGLTAGAVHSEELDATVVVATR